MFDLVECLDCGEVWTDNGKYCPACESPNNDWLDNVELLTA